MVRGGIGLGKWVRDRTVPNPLGLNLPATIAWSRSYGSNVTCSIGLKLSFRNVSTSRANTWAGGMVESIQFALIEIKVWPLFFRK